MTARELTVRLNDDVTGYKAALASVDETIEREALSDA